MAFPAVPGSMRLHTAVHGQSADTARGLFAQGSFDAFPGGFFLARDALCVDLEKDSDAVSCPLGNLRSRAQNEVDYPSNASSNASAVSRLTALRPMYTPASSTAGSARVDRRSVKGRPCGTACLLFCASGQVPAPARGPAALNSADNVSRQRWRYLWDVRGDEFGDQVTDPTVDLVADSADFGLILPCWVVERPI